MSSELKSSFDTNGHVVGPVVLQRHEISLARRAVDDVFRGSYPTGRAPQAVLWSHGDDPRRLRQVINAWWAHPALFALASHLEIVQIAADLLGARRLRLWEDEILYKPPGATSAGIGWHRDWHYWGETDRPGLITAWIAIDGANPDNGGMRFVPGSHVTSAKPGGDFEASPEDGALRELGAGGSSPVGIVLAPGQVSFHHAEVLHSSSPNMSDAPRLAYAAHYIDDEVRAADRPGTAARHNLYLLRSAGGDVGDPFDAHYWPLLLS